MNDIHRGYGLTFGKQWLHVCEFRAQPKTVIRKYPLCGGVQSRYWGPDSPGNAGSPLAEVIGWIDSGKNFGLPLVPALPAVGGRPASQGGEVSGSELALIYLIFLVLVVVALIICVRKFH